MRLSFAVAFLLALPCCAAQDPATQAAQQATQQSQQAAMQAMHDAEEANRQAFGDHLTLSLTQDLVVGNVQVAAKGATAPRP